MYKATDACGNASLVTQVITQIDEEAPVFDQMLEDQQMTFEAYSNFAQATVSASDNCSEVIVTGPVVEEAGDCKSFNYLHTYTATDACGLMVTTSQRISITDAVPQFEFLEPAETDCGEEMLISLDHLSTTDKIVTWNLIEGTDQGWTINDFNSDEATVLSGEGEALIEVVATNDLGCVALQRITLTCEAAVVNSTANIPSIERINVMPNPVSSILNLSLSTSADEAFNLRIVDMLGRTVETQSIDVFVGDNSFQFDVSEYTAGTYFIHLQNGISHQAIKFVKQ